MIQTNMSNYFKSRPFYDITHPNEVLYPYLSQNPDFDPVNVTGLGRSCYRPAVMGYNSLFFTNRLDFMGTTNTTLAKLYPG